VTIPSLSKKPAEDKAGKTEKDIVDAALSPSPMPMGLD